MRIITEPTVTVISAPQFLAHPSYRIPEDGTDLEKIGAFAAKGCYDSFLPKGRSNIANQQEVLSHGHGSVLEHINVGLFIEGITRACSLELVRHRAGFAFSQRSTRYVAEEEAAIVLEPYFADIYHLYGPELESYMKGHVPAVPDNRPEIKLLADHIDTQAHCLLWYEEQVETLMALNPYDLKGFELRKWARGKARNVLPHGLETRLTMTGNLRAWRHVITLRSEPHAEDEIRRLAGHLYDVLAPLAPTYFDDFQIQHVRGLRTFVPRHPKV